MKKIIIIMVFGVCSFSFVNTFFDVSSSQRVDSKNLLNPQHTIVIAHRGASGYAPEHTLLAYQMSQKTLKADYIEIDLQMTKDGHLIVMHDETVDRTTNGTGLVKNKTLAEIKRLDAGSWFNIANPQYAKEEYKGLRVPTLEEVFITYGTRANYYIETKSPDQYPMMEEKLLTLLKKYGLSSELVKPGQVIIQSFNKNSLMKVRRLDAQIPLIQLMDKNTIKAITPKELDSIQNYAVGIGSPFEGLTKENVKLVRKHGLLVHTYTLNEKNNMKKMLEYGVTGGFTNYADRFTEAIQEFKRTGH